MNINEIKLKANQIRQLTIKSIYHAQSGHPGGALSSADILSVLYFDIMNLNVNNPKDENRDCFVLSKGHSAPAYYAALALKGFIDIDELNHLRQGEEFLQGHPCMNKTNGVDYSSGSLGQGLSIANGMALYCKANDINNNIYCLCGDGEVQEGQIWEASMLAAHYHLDNVILIIDHNDLQIDGNVHDVMNVDSLKKKFEGFNWNTFEVDGHDVIQLSEVFNKAKNLKNGKPSCIIANTVKGKGVSFMENQAGWHGAAPNQEQYEIAMKELGE